MLPRSVSHWKRVYWAVWFANLITSIGMMSFLPFFPTHLGHLGITDGREIATWSGLIYGAAPLMAGVMGPVWGSLGDRFGRKLMVLRALVAIGFFIGCMAFARTPFELFGLRLLQGVFSGFVAPSITLVSVAAPPGIQGRVTGTLQTALAVGTIAGPLLGAFVESRYGLSALFLCVSGAAFASALVVLVLVREGPIERGAGPMGWGGWGGWGVGARALLGDVALHGRSADLRRMLWIVFSVQFAVGTTLPLLELYVREVWDGDAARVPGLTAALFSLMAIVDLVCMPLWGHLGDRRGHREMLGRSTLFTGVALLLHAVVPGYGALVVARLLLASACAGTKPCSIGLMAEVTPVERRGGAVGMVLSARQFGVSLSAMAGGGLSTLLGLHGLFAASGFVLVLVAFGVRRKRSLDASPA